MSRTEIDGDQVQDETITGSDIKDDSLSLSDISQAALDDIENQAGFNPGSTEIVSTKLGDAIREVSTTAGASASPGYSFGRSANAGPGAWLLRVGNVPSNKTGIPVAIANPSLTLISIGNENINTFDVGIYEHEGDEINITLLTTVSVVNKRTDNFIVDIAVTTGRQLAARVISGSAKNIGVSLQLKGNTV